MKTNFKKALNAVLVFEGGYVNDPSDPGGETKFGISRRSYPDLDIKKLTKKTAGEVYRPDYWDACRCDDLPGGVDLIVFDTAVNQGPRFAVRSLQTAAGVTVDGLIGPQTLGAANDFQGGAGSDLVCEIAAIRGERYAKTKNFDRYGHGWMRRLMHVTTQAVSMATTTDKT
jgi:lysozyme family protein